MKKMICEMPPVHAFALFTYTQLPEKFGPSFYFENVLKKFYSKYLVASLPRKFGKPASSMLHVR